MPVEPAHLTWIMGFFILYAAVKGQWDFTHILIGIGALVIVWVIAKIVEIFDLSI